MRETTPDPFVLEAIIGNKTTEKQNNKHSKQQAHIRNKTIKKQKNITFSLSLDTIHLLEEVWLKLRKTDPKATKTGIVEFALKKALSDIESIKL